VWSKKLNERTTFVIMPTHTKYFGVTGVQNNCHGLIWPAKIVIGYMPYRMIKCGHNILNVDLFIPT